MAMELGEKYPFSVDTWTLSSRRKRHHFLTHAHKDHTSGIECHGSYPIFSSPITIQLVLHRYPKLHASMFVELQLEEPKLVENDDGSFTVTAYDANHCPGAIMLLFEGSFGNLLHTGDCRLTRDCYCRLPRSLFYGCLDTLLLDCTFGKEDAKMPIKEEAINQVKQCIWNHPNAPIVYLACDLLGQESLLQSISTAFGLKIYVDKVNLGDFHATISAVAPDLITNNPDSTRFHVCEGFPKLFEKAKQRFAEAYLKGQPEPLFIRPSAQWYTYGERQEGAGSGLIFPEKVYPKVASIRRRRAKSVPLQAERDEFGIWHVCFSMHSSREELEAFLQKLRPKQVISTNPNCKPTELEYVRESTSFSATYKSSISTIIRGCKVAVDEVQVIKMGKSVREEVTCEVLSSATESATESGKQSVNMLLESNLENGLLTSPNKAIPLFGMAIEGVPPSPPLSFDSEDAVSTPPSRNAAPGVADTSFLLSKPKHRDNVGVAILAQVVDIHKQSSSHFHQSHLIIDDHGEDEDEDDGLIMKGQALERSSHGGDVKMKRRKPERSSYGGGFQLPTVSVVEECPTEAKDEEEEEERWFLGIKSISSASYDEGTVAQHKGRTSQQVLDESTRSMYRSLHMPIPRPLPSLLDMARYINKRPKLNLLFGALHLCAL